MRTFQLKVTEDELKALIHHHRDTIYDGSTKFTTETSERLHQLMKRLHKTGADITSDDNETEKEQPAPAAPYSNEFAVDGAKIGDTLRIRLPSDFIVTDGQAEHADDDTAPAAPSPWGSNN